MHHIYTTKSYILGSSPTGEANKYFSVFTQDLGLVLATAQGVRKNTSKLRYGLQDYSYSEISLVRGANMWRITNAVSIKNLYSEFSGDGEKMAICAEVFGLLKKMLAGEEKNARLFSVVNTFLEFMGSRDFSRDELKNIEGVTVLRILSVLGYLRQDKDLDKFILSEGFDDGLIADMNKQRNMAVLEINKALKESQLMNIKV